MGGANQADAMRVGTKNPGRLWSRPGLSKVFYLTVMVTVEVKAGL